MHLLRSIYDTQFIIKNTKGILEIVLQNIYYIINSMYKIKLIMLDIYIKRRYIKFKIQYNYIQKGYI